jgi:hypothetical protein
MKRMVVDQNITIIGFLKHIREWSLILLFLLYGCVTEFVPEVMEEEELLVVEGLITDQPGINTIKLSKSLPVGQKSDARPMTGCMVTLSDDLGNVYPLNETAAGTYVTDSITFKGTVGRFYTLQIATNEDNNSLTYESSPMEMKPVPPVDSVYYEKKAIEEPYENFKGIDACEIYLDTYDPENRCRYFRWDFSETWVLRLLFPVENIKCWISDKSNTIDIKNTTSLEESRIVRHPVAYISNVTDRLKTKYSILVNQYSLNEDEYLFWERLQNLTVQVGGLYDIIPSSIPSNLRCIEKPDEKVLGYFSVSAKKSKRIFIQDTFEGIINAYNDCITDTIYGDYDPPELYISLWPLIDHPPQFGSPRMRVLSDDKGCADCTVRGTTEKPDFWIGE